MLNVLASSHLPICSYRVKAIGSSNTTKPIEKATDSVHKRYIHNNKHLCIIEDWPYYICMYIGQRRALVQNTIALYINKHRSSAAYCLQSARVLDTFRKRGAFFVRQSKTTKTELFYNMHRLADIGVQFYFVVEKGETTLWRRH